MKNKAILLSLGILMMSCYSPKVNHSDLLLLNLKKNVREITTKRFIATEENGKITKQKEIELKSYYDSNFLGRTGADEFLYNYLNKDIFQEHIIGGEYIVPNNFFDYTASFNEKGRLNSLALPKSYMGQTDTLSYKYSKNKTEIYNKAGKLIETTNYNEDGRMISCSRGNQTVTHKYNGIYLSHIFYTDNNTTKTVKIVNANNSLSYLTEGLSITKVTYSYKSRTLDIYTDKEMNKYLQVKYNKSNRVSKISTIRYEKEARVEFDYNKNDDITEQRLIFIKKGIPKIFKKMESQYIYDNKGNWTKRVDKLYEYTNNYIPEKPSSISVIERSIKYYD